MPWSNNHLPKYRKYQASGQAVVTLNGQDFYLGPHGTRASKLEYDRLIGEWPVERTELSAQFHPLAGLGCSTILGNDFSPLLFNHRWVEESLLKCGHYVSD